MFDHFQIMFGLQKTTIFKQCETTAMFGLSVKTPKINFLEKNFLIFRQTNFFFTEFFLKKISGACPSRKNVHVFEKT